MNFWIKNIYIVAFGENPSLVRGYQRIIDMLSGNYIVYMLRMNDNSLYTGITNDLEKRLKDHAQGRGSKYVKSRLPFKLVYMQGAPDKFRALSIENKIKSRTKSEKERLITLAEQCKCGVYRKDLVRCICE